MTLRSVVCRGLLIGLLLVPVAGCDGSVDTGSGGRDPVTTDTAASSPAASTAATSATTTPPESTKTAPPGAQQLRLADASPAVPGRDYRPITTISGDLPGGLHLVVHVVDPEGNLVADVSEPTDTETITPESMVIYRPGRGIVRYLSHGSGPPGAVRQVTSAVATRRWVVWTETPSTSLAVDPWTLFSFDLLTGTLRRIATAPRMSDGTVPAAPGYTRPSLAADARVYLTVVEQTGPGKYQTFVESVPVDGSGPLRREASGIAPSASGMDLVWQGGPTDHLVFWHRDLATGHDTRLFDETGTSCHSFYGLGTAGGVVGWLLQCKGADLVQIWAGGQPLATIRDPGHNLGYLRVTSRYVGFAPTRQSGQYRQILYDVRRQKLLSIGHGSVSGDMPGNGPYLMWSSYPPPRSDASGSTHLVRLID